MSHAMQRSDRQFTLKEIMIGVAFVSVVLAIARVVGSFGAPDLGVFVVATASTLLATSRLFYWLAVGALFAILTAVLTQIGSADPKFAISAGGSVLVYYAFVGTPLAIANARGLHLRRWMISQFGIVLVATALTPADPISTLLVYVPLQLAMLGYSFFAKDGAETTEQATE